MKFAWLMPRRRRGTILFAIGLVLILAAGAWRLRAALLGPPEAPLSHLGGEAESPQEGASDDEAIEFPRPSWKAASLEIQPIERAAFSQTVELTGKIALNEDRVAHIFPLVEGRVDEVRVQFGDRVKQNDVLVVVQSKEVGQAMLQLYQDRLQRDFALTKDRWTQEAAANAQTMIKLMRAGAAIEEIERQLKERPLGEHRDRLMTAYISHDKARKQFDRVAPLAKEGAVTGRQLLEAESEWSAARATLQSLLEQIQQDAQQDAAISAQSVKELQTRVAVDETNLKILGFDDRDLAAIDPGRQGEAISHYPIVAPFDGAIISKDVVLLERVGPETQILSIADLSTVWVTADIYEEHLPLLAQLDGQVVRLRSSAWPSKVFEAQVFYTGDLVEEASRTVSLRALADNRDGLLKPGMFVRVELSRVGESEALLAPRSAVLDHEGKSFVFVHLGGDRFARRDVTLGRRNAQSVEIEAGLAPGERVVTRGGFALKSQMLAELLSE